jgi:hypothetical protein
VLRGEERTYVRFTTKVLFLRVDEVSTFMASPSQSQIPGTH